MGQIRLNSQRIGLTRDGALDFQSIRDDNGVDPEYHAFMTLGRAADGEQAIYMIVRIIDPTGESVVEYHVNYNSEKAGAVEFETAWTGRAGLTYVRYDKILSTFFPL
jgi:hypothetical protein